MPTIGLGGEELPSSDAFEIVQRRARASSAPLVYLIPLSLIWLEQGFALRKPGCSVFNERPKV